MRFTIRQLFAFVAVVGLFAAIPISIYRSYNHRVALFDVGDGIQIEFRSKYEDWRGPRRILSVMIYEPDGKVTDLTTRVPTFYFNRTPKLYFSSDRNYFCATYPDRGNYIVGDLTTNEFGTRYLGNGTHVIWNWPENEVDTRWRPVLESINANNPQLDLN